MKLILGSVLSPLSLILIILNSSCTNIYTAMYGFQKVDQMDERSIRSYSLELNIPEESLYQIDSSYLNYLQSLSGIVDSSTIKNHVQPLQALYYNSEGELISFHVNCYAGGFPNLKWNRNNNFEQFPPNQQAPADTLLALNKHLTYLEKVDSQNNRKWTKSSDSDYTVIIYWNKFMGRQSKNLIEIVQENLKMNNTQNVAVYYVNNDKLFLGQ